MRDAVNDALCDAWNDGNRLYGEDKLEECIDKCRELLSDPALARYRYHQMKTLLLLATTVGDLDEAGACWEQAELLWRIERRWHVVGDDEVIDECMEEVRDMIDELRTTLQEEAARDADADEDEDENEDEEAAIEEERALSEAENDDEGELLKADAAALGVSKEELSKSHAPVSFTVVLILAQHDILTSCSCQTARAWSSRHRRTPQDHRSD